jgi:hypothetical protein
MMKQSEEREYYRLWFEYLRESDDYREFCDWGRQKRKNPNIKVPRKFRKDKHGWAPRILFTYFQFRNIYVATFDQWWDEYYHEHAENLRLWEKKNSIEDLRDYLEKDIKWGLDGINKLDDPELTKQRLANYLARCVTSTGHRSDKLLLIVDPRANLTDVLEPRLRELVEKFRKEQSARKKSRTNFEDLENYLRIYRLWKRYVKEKGPGQRGGWKKIMAEMNISRGGDLEHQRRYYQQCKQKAAKIIKNAEKGIFPGDYQ